MTLNKLKSALKAALNEKDVENTWRAFLLANLPESSFTSPFNCDGLLQMENASILCEFKYSTELSSQKDLLAVLGQIVSYLHVFKKNNLKLPDTIFLGDKNECSVLPIAALAKYADTDFNYAKFSPSDAGKNLGLMAALLKDQELAPVVFDIEAANFRWEPVLTFLQRQVGQQKADVLITADNLPSVYDYWVSHVVKDKALTPDDGINVFYSVLLNPQNVFLHPKKEVLVVGSREVKISRRGYTGFFSLYKETHNPLELREITANKDRLLTDTRRRRTGAFFTPADWVNEAHRMLEENLGKNWRDEYVVWDASCGTGNLTRDYVFKELYLSTLEQHDIDVIQEAGYNPGATVFQFDFLNDDLEKLPAPLLASLKAGKKFVFFNNPPYGTANNIKGITQGEAARTGVASTAAGDSMRALDMGPASQQLFAQFVFRINEVVSQHALRVAYMAQFGPTLFMTGAHFAKLRSKVVSLYGLVTGMVFRASHFADVADAWPICFSVFKYGKPAAGFVFDVKDYAEDGRIKLVGKKEMYSMDNCIAASEWVRAGSKGERTFDAPQMTNPVNVASDGSGKIATDALGYFHNAANNTQYNSTAVGLYTSAFSNGHGLSITRSNLSKVVSLFVARKLVDSDWTNGKDEYSAPDESHPDYEQFVADAHVFSLFHSASNQSSLRNITYKEKNWNIINHFFWMPRLEVQKLAVKHSNNQVYNDTINHPHDPYLVEKLGTLKLSPDAEELLHLAREFVVDSFEHRAAADMLKPEMHINTWDAGWYQIRNAILKDQFTDRYKAFMKKHKDLANRMRTLVYELGFLRK